MTTPLNTKYKDFDDIVVSTKTFIVKTNLVIDLKKLFDFLPVTDYVQLPKKRGRKKKIAYEEQNKDIINGSIITLKYENQIKGVDLKIRKSKKKKSKWFRNSFTVVIIIDCKPINFKICQNGMFQITGAKFDSQAEDCIKYIWSLISDQSGSIYNYSKGSSLEAIFIPAMRNIDFSLGFHVDREKLTRYMNSQTEFHSLLETSFGYTGVNIKFPIKDDIREMKLKKLSFKDTSTNPTPSYMSYGDYLSELTEKEQQKKLKKNRYTTFLVFHSGKVIVSSITAEVTKPAYNYFHDIIRRCRHEIEEKLDV
jgi:TATA-box binding protein (TBP) (component of TFIID and TFIIIB)